MDRLDSRAPSPISVSSSACLWWKEIAGRKGPLAATRQLLHALWGFIRDSTPERRRQRYGDATFDWDHRVNTTSAAIHWRDRLLGIFHSPYQPTDADLFHEMIAALREQSRIDYHDFVFIDLGSGKGRTLLMASNYPFRRILGVELLPALHLAAQENISKYRGESQKCFALESICGDATEFFFPPEPTVIFLFNPFPESVLRQVIAKLENSLAAHPRQVYVLYHNPLLDHVLSQNAALRPLAGTHQYSIYASR